MQKVVTTIITRCDYLNTINHNDNIPCQKQILHE